MIAIQITSNNLNKSINYTSTTTTNHESQDIGSNYGNIVEGAAITGAIAAGTVELSEYLKPTIEKGADVAVYKPTSKLANDPGFIAKYPDYANTGVIDKTANNIGMANTTGDLSKVGTVVNPSDTMPWNEGSPFMNKVNNIGGMNDMATNIHDPWSSTNLVKSIPGTTQLSIVPAMAIEYCALAPTLCATGTSILVNDKFNK